MPIISPRAPALARYCGGVRQYLWAEIALAAIAGMAFYGLVALAERATTFWHPSYRT